MRTAKNTDYRPYLLSAVPKPLTPSEMETPFLDRLIGDLQNHIRADKAIGYYAEIPELEKELAQYEAIKKAVAKLHFIEALLSEENAKKMAFEYTGAEEEYQGFLLACEVIAEKIKQTL